MEKYRKKIKARIILLSILALLSLSIEVANVFWVSEELKEHIVFSFQCGLAAAIALLALILVYKYSKALRNDRALELIYNSEHDERMRAIRAKAGQPLLLFVSIALLFAGIVIGYFNSVVFYTLVSAVAFQTIISCVIKMIYMKIM